MNPERIVVATVAEDRDPWRTETVALFRSLRLLGGRMSNAQGIAFFVDSAADHAREALADLDVRVAIVPPVDPERPYLNKLRMFEHEPGGDYLVALDTDIVVAGDFSDFVQGLAIAAKAVDQDRLTLSEWEELYTLAGLELPRARLQTTFDFVETVPYFNSGVVIVPGECVERLHASWLRHIEVVKAAAEQIPSIATNIFFLDQFAFALAVVAGRFPFRGLPLEMNFPTHYPIHAAARPDSVEPLLIHHHHRTSPAEGILSTPYEAPNRAIRRVNEICALRLAERN